MDSRGTAAASGAYRRDEPPDINIPRVTYLNRERHWPGESTHDPIESGPVSKWRMKDRMKTGCVAIVLCLNFDVDPPDLVRLPEMSRMECWIEPSSMPPKRAVETVGKSLQAQYERWQSRAKYKLLLDPPAEDVKKLCHACRKVAKNERVLFHYNGHGVPRPTGNGEIWLFNQLALIEAEEQRQLAAEAVRLQVEAAAAAEKQRLQAEAEADTQAHHKEAQDLLQRHEATSIERLKFWHFEPSEEHDDATLEEQHKEFLAKLVTLLDLEQVTPRPNAGETSSAPSTRQLEERVDHVVGMLGDIVTFAAPATISKQLDTLKTEVQQLHQLPNKDGNTAQHYKMPTFQIEKFNDYTHQDPVLWWEGFTTQLRILFVPKHSYIGALFLNSKGGCQIWLSHLATFHGVQVADLKDKISWEELTRLWKKRFIMDDAPTLAINRLVAMMQGNTSTRDWLTEWQTIAVTPDLELPFSHLCREFYNRSCAALSLALGDCEQYATFAEIIDKAREIVKTNRAAAHEKSAWQPTYVEKGKFGPPPQHVAAVHTDNIVEDPAATQASREGDQVAVVQPRSNNNSRGKGKAKIASPAGNGQPAPWVEFHLTEAEYKWRGRCAGGEVTPPLTPPDSAAVLAASYTSGEDANVASPRFTYEDYAVHLVPPLDQPLHVQQSTACTVSLPSATDSATSPSSIAGDSTTWSRLEELDPLTFADFQWMPLPRSGRLPKPHCNVLMAQLRDYLHTAVPTPLMDVGVEVVDLHAYIAKIDHEFKTQRYDDIDAALLYIRIQIGETTCSALIDCGATRNYMSDFMVRAGLGPHVQRKRQPTQVTLADGHTHRSIDRCIDAVPVYFAPHASEAVSFDILDTKFDIILGMPWLRSEDQPVNFYRRTVHVRHRNGVLVPWTVPPPHPSISCHVVSATSIRASIIWDDIEDMGVCLIHARPPQDIPLTDSPPDPCIIELLDAYGDVFETPHGVVPDRPIRHEIILEDGAVPPRGCIYLMKGWIRPSSSPYGAPVLFVWKKNKELRLCIDYRKLNVQTDKSADPLPCIDDLLERLGGAKFFSKLDLKSGYHQLEIRQEDRYKTAFKTRYGHFEWLVMPFGLTNAPATFQATMTMEFRHMLDRFVLIYLDDILVYNRSLDEHMEHLRTILERLRQAKYKANRDKCEFARQELEYSRHYVTPQGIRPLADKIEAICIWPEPTNTTDVRSFMGLAGYYQSFITGYSRIAAPMTRLQSPKMPFVFDDDARWLFQALKTAMLMAPVLSIYDPTPPTRVTTDASGYGIGAVLEQHDGDDGHPVEYFSHKVPRINSLDDARKKELLAFVMALKRWRHFLLGRRRFTWVTDNNPLTYYKTQDTVSSTIDSLELLAQACANMQKAQVRMQQQANRHRVPCPIRAGDLVWVSAEEFALEQDVSRKLLPKWFGPWPVTSAARDEPDGPSFVINIPPHLTVQPVFHSSKLATYTPAKSDDFPGRRSQDPPSMDGHQEVDRVITDRKYGSKPRQYKVTFKACDPDDTRWISGTDLKASAPLIYAHYERQRLAQGPSRPAPPTRNVVPPSDGQLRPRSAWAMERQRGGSGVRTARVPWMDCGAGYGGIFVTLFGGGGAGGVVGRAGGGMGKGAGKGAGAGAGEGAGGEMRRGGGAAGGGAREGAEEGARGETGRGGGGAGGGAGGGVSKL
ncbi:hypothetical protein CBR_g54868 [Chara braunii]|uniref:Reverse transcriptase domain-containing protein n=1 Tax=Chara braunii TaxID=69332 RepID=A0A388JPP9_CHABU|nr:hypothetical protein CBR_g54868 [Chara braunii]|eukprot:GBG59765.1 hypothetical protein CBR_g54868 [Chara braunii]